MKVTINVNFPIANVLEGDPIDDEINVSEVDNDNVPVSSPDRVSVILILLSGVSCIETVMVKVILSPRLHLHLNLHQSH